MRRSVAEHAAAVQEHWTRIQAIKKQLADALIQAGATVECTREPYNPKKYNLMYPHSFGLVNGVNANLVIHVDREWCYPAVYDYEHEQRKVWSAAHASSMHLAQFTNYSQRFVEGKKGFKYAEIAQAVIRYTDYCRERTNDTERQERNREASQVILTGLTAKHSSTPNYFWPVSNSVGLELRTQHHLDIDVAIALLQTLKANQYSGPITLDASRALTEEQAAAVMSWAVKAGRINP